MGENHLQKKPRTALKEKSQYMLAFGVIASMLLVVGFPVFVVFFLGIFAYFLWKIFSSGSRNDTREIFEFYLAANDILRDDERRWFGFEMKDVVARGEKIVQSMSGSPPLVHFTLGAIYSKLGDHKAAAQHLAYVVENEKSDERAVVYPSAELRNYVRVLRKIEREPAEAPLTSGAVRALERARKNRARALLEDSRARMAAEQAVTHQIAAEKRVHDEIEVINNQVSQSASRDSVTYTGHESVTSTNESGAKGNGNSKEHNEDQAYSNRKPISEVLHEIYDKNFQ